MCLVVRVKFDDVKRKKKSCIGTWKARLMNQVKFDDVKQEMTRVNIDILGISELKWMGMGDINSDNHYIYYYGQVKPKKMKLNGSMQNYKTFENTLNICHFHEKGLEHITRKSTDTW